MVKILEVAEPDSRRSEVAAFIKFAAKRLGISELPRFVVTHDKAEAKRNGSMGYTAPEQKVIWAYFGERFLPDVLRTIAHELVHWKQAEDGKIGDDSGETGSPEENEANSVAGVLMREYASERPAIFESKLLAALGEARR